MLFELGFVFYTVRIKLHFLLMGYLTYLILVMEEWKTLVMTSNTVMIVYILCSSCVYHINLCYHFLHQGILHTYVLIVKSLHIRLNAFSVPHLMYETFGVVHALFASVS